MSLYADIRRRFDSLRGPNLAGSLARDRPEASSAEQPCGRREPHGTPREGLTILRLLRGTRHGTSAHGSQGHDASHRDLISRTPSHRAGHLLATAQNRQTFPGFDRSAYLAIAEALHDGADVVPASDEVGRQLAADGVSLLEALDGLSALYRSIAGGEPAFAAVRALSSSWAEASLIYLHSLSCEDPLTGLSSLAHLRSRLGEIYREADLRGTSVPATHALVVVEPLGPPGITPFDRELRLIDVAECLRIVFAGGDVLGRVGSHRAAALVDREPNLPEQVATVGALITQWRLDTDEPQLARIWIEGLPATDAMAVRLLDELTRR